MSILDKLKDIKLDTKLLENLKKDKFIIKDPSLINDNKTLICNPPKELYYLKEDWNLLNLISTIYYSYVLISENWKVEILKGKARIVKYINVEKEIEDKDKTEKNSIRIKVLYDLAQIEKKYKWKKTVKLGKNLVYIKYLNRGFNKYDVFILKKDGSKIKKTIEAATEEQANLLINYIINKNRKRNNYDKVDYIYRKDFWKTFWEAMFFVPQKRKKLTTKELLDFTRKLYKIHKSDPNLSWIGAIEHLIASSDWNVRATAIALKSISVWSWWTVSLSSVYKVLNNENIKIWLPIAFDEIYIKIIELAEKKWTSTKSKDGEEITWMEVAYFNLEEIINRKLFLESALKKALRWPLITLSIILLLWLLIVKKFSVIVFAIYDWINEARPPATVVLVNLIDFLLWSSFNPLIFNSLFHWDWMFFWSDGLLVIPFHILTLNITLIIFWIILVLWIYKFFTKSTFYGKKFIHNVYLTTPLFWNFIKRSDFEIFLTVWENLYSSTASSHTEALPLLKDVVRNYHIKGILNTAYLRFVNEAVSPDKIFVLFPEYIPDKIASLFKNNIPESMEMIALKNTYKDDNDDFINNLKALVSQMILFISWLILLFIVFATIVPMFQLASKI